MYTVLPPEISRVLIRPHYLLVSRKSTFIASLRPLDDEDFHRLLDHYRDISLREFLLSLNFGERLAERIIAELPFAADERLPDTARHPHFQALRALPSFRAIYEKRRNEQAENLRAYLHSFAVDFATEPLYLVDVGWKGSIQDNLFHLLGGTVTVHGFYIGSYNGTERSERNRKTGLLFTDYPRQSPFFQVYNSNRSLFEMLLGASHGSADQYRREDAAATTAEPPQTIHETRQTASGPLQIIVKDLPEEHALYTKTIKPLQDRLLTLFNEMTTSYLQAGGRLPDEAWFAKQHGRMVFLPTDRELAWFEDLYHLENFGIFEFTTFSTAHRFSLVERLGHLKNIIRHPGVLETGIWPPIILRRFGVGFWQQVDGRRRWYRSFSRRSPK